MVSVMEKQLIPAGYKQTEVGVIPDEWNSIQVQDVCDFIVPGRNKPLKFNGDIPWITTPDLTDCREVYFSRAGLKISKEEAKSVGSKIVPVGSVIMSCVGEIGVVAIAGRNVVLNQQLHAFLPSEKINNYYLVYALKNQESYFYSMATKTALPYLNKDNCNSTPLPLPSIQEQTAIANALSDVDALIAALEKLINKKSAIKTAAMQQLLTGKKRLPPFDQLNTGYKQSELGEIPGDWDVMELGGLGQFKNGINKDADSFGYGTPFVNLMDVFGKPSINEIKELGLIDATENDLKEYDLKSGDVLFIRSSVKPSGVGLTSVVKKNLDKTVYSGFLIRFRSNETLEPVFKEHCFYQSDFRKRIIASSSVSANTNINQDNLKQISLVVPPLAEQTAIANVLSDMDKDLEALQQRLHKTQQIKQGMMQELLTGKTRLVKPQGASNA